MEEEHEVVEEEVGEEEVLRNVEKVGSDGRRGG